MEAITAEERHQDSELHFSETEQSSSASGQLWASLAQNDEGLEDSETDVSNTL